MILFKHKRVNARPLTQWLTDCTIKSTFQITDSKANKSSFMGILAMCTRVEILEEPQI